MARGNRFTIAFAELPTAFTFTTEGNIYICRLVYNSEGDFIAFGTYLEGTGLIHSGKLVYGSNMNETSDNLILRNYKIIPLDITYETTLVGSPEVNRETFGSTVFLYTSLEDT